MTRVLSTRPSRRAGMGVDVWARAYGASPSCSRRGTAPGLRVVGRTRLFLASGTYVELPPRRTTRRGGRSEVSSCAGLREPPTPPLSHQPPQHTPSATFIGVFFRIVKRQTLEKYVTESYPLSARRNVLAVRITTAGVRAVRRPCHAEVSHGMVNGRAACRSTGGAAEDERCVLSGGTAVAFARTPRRGVGAQGSGRRRRTTHGKTQSDATTYTPTGGGTPA